MSLYFTYETRGSLKLFSLFITVKATTRLNLEYIDKFSIEKFKELSRRGSRSPDNAEFGHFTLLFHRGRQRNVQKIISHLNSHCSPHYTFCLATFPLPSWFSFKLLSSRISTLEGWAERVLVSFIQTPPTVAAGVKRRLGTSQTQLPHWSFDQYKCDDACYFSFKTLPYWYLISLVNFVCLFISLDVFNVS